MSNSDQQLTGEDLAGKFRELQSDPGTTPAVPAADGKMSPDDILGKVRELQDGVGEVAGSKKDTMIQIAAAGGVILLLLMFLLGQRAGRKKSTFVEIRRL